MLGDGKEQACPLGAVHEQFRPQGKQCPPNGLSVRVVFVLHLPLPGLNQRCVSGFVAVTPLVSFVESGIVRSCPAGT